VTLAIAPLHAIAQNDPHATIGSQLASTAIDDGAREILIAAARGLELHEARFDADGPGQVDLKLWLAPASAEKQRRVIDAALRSLRVFSSWYGLPPASSLLVIDVPWRSPVAGASYPGVIAITVPWLEPARDMTLERSMIGAMARQYVFGAQAHDPNQRWFDEAIALYTGTRAVHEALENGDGATVRFFGGLVPVVIRPVEWSPNRADPRPRVRHFAEIDGSSVTGFAGTSAEDRQRAQRGALALHTLERYIGWPAMQPALATYRVRAKAAGGSPDLFNTVVSEQRGRDLSWFFANAFRPDARFDYAVDLLSSEPTAGGSTEFRTTVGVRRLGDAVFAGTSEVPTGAFATGRALPLLVRFQDGSTIEDGWDGRDAEKRFEYLSRSRAVSASLDPVAVVLLDEDRTNNTRTLQPSFNRIGARLALHWMVWLQDLMLTCTAFA
jgi:hypothetical protein